MINKNYSVDGFVKLYEPEIANLDSNEIYNIHIAKDEISLVVSTSKDELNDYICRIKRLPSGLFGNGEGKMQHLLNLEKLVIEAASQKDFENLQRQDKNKWKIYREACLEVAVLSRVLLGVDFQLVE